MTTGVVFGLLVGWLGAWAWMRAAVAMARGSLMWRVAAMTGRALPMGWGYALARLVSWACFLALAVGGLWRVAQVVARG